MSKAKDSPWKEIHFDDARMLSLFPRNSERKLMTFSGGPFHLGKAKSFRENYILKHTRRKNYRINKRALDLDDSMTTMGNMTGDKIKVN